jgi:hypothetical protein
LRKGVAKGETVETCKQVQLELYKQPFTNCYLGTAGAGSLILEFATLSRLTGDDRFEKAAYKVCSFSFFLLIFEKSIYEYISNHFSGFFCLVEP